MEKKQAAAPVPQPAKGEFDPHMDAGHADAGRQMFVSAALSMSWQLAVVVLVPVLVGHWLDDKFTSAPGFTIAGFVLALVLSALVLRLAMKEFAVGPSKD